MPTLIRLDDGKGPLVEVVMQVPEAERASSGTVIKIVDKGFEDIIGTLSTIVRPFSATWKELSKDVEISEATVTLSLGITAEGNFFVAKGNASANLTLELKMTPRPVAPEPRSE